MNTTYPLNEVLRTIAYDSTGYGGRKHACELRFTELRNDDTQYPFYYMSLTPICRRYRKADGTVLAKHRRYPHSIRTASNILTQDPEAWLDPDGAYSEFSPEDGYVCRQCVAVYLNGGDGQPRSEAATEEATRTLETISKDGGNLPELLKPLNSGQRSALKRVVLADFADLRAGLNVELERFKAGKKKELEELFGGGEKERAAILTRFREQEEEINARLKELREEMREAGFESIGSATGMEFRVHLPTQLKPAEYDRQVQLANNQAMSLHRLAVSVAEKEKTRLLRLIDLSAVDATVAANLVDLVPSASDVFTQAMADLTGQETAA